MVDVSQHIIRGPWRRLVNTSATSAGSIHDDEQARKGGFEGGFVPGSTVGSCALSAAFTHFGTRLFEGGWYGLTFVSPVYEHTDVRAVGEPDPSGNDLILRVEARDGRVCCSGRAGLVSNTPWNAADDGARGAEGVLPAIPIGLTFAEIEFNLSADDVRQQADASGDEAAYYRGPSPWGASLIPPERLMTLALRMPAPRELQYDGVRMPGMWAKHDLVLHAPLFQGTTYRMRNRVADKGRSGRTVFLTYEFSVYNAAREELAVGRHTVKWFAAE